MKKYYIEDVEGNFWCEDHFGYWSKFDDSLKYRFEGIYLWVFPLFLMMKLANRELKPKIVKIPQEILK